MDALGHYVRLHLTGSSAGIELFSRGSAFPDPEAREVVGRIRDELVDERRRLLAIAKRHGIRPAPFSAIVVKVGERVGRLKPNGDLVHRTPLTDVVDLETMRVAVAGKIAGWEAMLTVDALPEAELEDLLAQARRQHDDLSTLHRDAAARALND